MENLFEGISWVSSPGIRKNRESSSNSKTYFLHGNGKQESYEIVFSDEDAQLIFDTVGNSLDLDYADYDKRKALGMIRIKKGERYTINHHEKKNKNGSIAHQYRLSCIQFGRYFEQMVGMFTHYHFKAEPYKGDVVLIATGERDRDGKK